MCSRISGRLWFSRLNILLRVVVLCAFAEHASSISLAEKRERIVSAAHLHIISTVKNQNLPFSISFNIETRRRCMLTKNNI